MPLDEAARVKRDDDLMSAYILAWGQVVDYAQGHHDTKAIALLIDELHETAGELEDAEAEGHERRIGQIREARSRARLELDNYQTDADAAAKRLCEVAETARNAVVRQFDEYLKAKERKFAQDLGKKLDEADETVQGLKEGMGGTSALPHESDPAAIPARSSAPVHPLSQDRKRKDKKPHHTAYAQRRVRHIGEPGSRLRQVQSAASLSSQSSGAENALGKSHSRLGYRQALRYFGTGY